MGESPQGQSSGGVMQATDQGGGATTTSHPKICPVCGEERGQGSTCQACGSR